MSDLDLDHVEQLFSDKSADAAHISTWAKRYVPSLVAELRDYRQRPTVHVMMSSTIENSPEDVHDSLHVMGASEDVKLLQDTLATLRAENADYHQRIAAGTLLEVENSVSDEVDTERLYQSATADVWAEEFAKVQPDVDQGLMIGWFANAMETAKSLDHKARIAAGELIPAENLTQVGWWDNEDELFYDWYAASGQLVGPPKLRAAFVKDTET
jgi:hypothetical protein